MTKERNIPLFKVYMSEKASKQVNKVLESGFIGQGPVVDEFEDKLKDFFNCDYVATTNSATSAEHLALHLLKKQDKNINIFQDLGFSQSTWEGLKEGDK